MAGLPVQSTLTGDCGMSRYRLSLQVQSFQRAFPLVGGSLAGACVLPRNFVCACCPKRVEVKSNAARPVGNSFERQPAAAFSIFQQHFFRQKPNSPLSAADRISRDAPAVFIMSNQYRAEKILNYMVHLDDAGSPLRKQCTEKQDSMLISIVG